MPRIKLDLTVDEVVVLPPISIQVFHPCSDAPEDGIITRSYAYEDVFGEKIRALAERARPRDLYDVINLFRNAESHPDFRRHGPGSRQRLHPDHRRTLLRGSHGFAIGHITPEAAVGGPLALVKNGDHIAIDAARRKITPKVSKRELDRRRKALKSRRPRYRTGVLAEYARSVRSVSEGAVTDMPD